MPAFGRLFFLVATPRRDGSVITYCNLPLYLIFNLDENLYVTELISKIASQN